MRKRLGRGLIPAVIVGVSALLAAPVLAEQSMEGDSQSLTLMTKTPAEGFALAIALARRAVTETQPDKDVLHALRPGYAHNAKDLIAASHVVAVHFQTVAQANAFCRE